MSQITLKEYQEILTFTRVSQVSDRGFIMVVKEKIYLEMYIHNHYICLRNKGINTPSGSGTFEVLTLGIGSGTHFGAS